MRYLETENPYIVARFTTGDTVKITIYDMSNNSIIVNDVNMSEILSTGFFKYQFNLSPVLLTEYLYISNNIIEEHAGKIILGGFPDEIKDQIDKMNFIGDDIKATLDGEEVDINESALHSGLNAYPNKDNWKASGFATPSDVLNESGIRNAILSDSVKFEGAEIGLLRKFQSNRLELAEGSVNNWILYDDDNSPLLTFSVTDRDGNAIAIPAQAPARRSKAV